MNHRTIDPRVTYQMSRERRGGNWRMIVYVDGRDITSCSFAWSRPSYARAERAALHLAAVYVASSARTGSAVR